MPCSRPTTPLALAASAILALAIPLAHPAPTRAQAPTPAATTSPRARAYLPALLRTQAGFAPSRAIRTLRVPAEYATVKAALDEARDGDTVEVAAGTYRAPSLQVPAGVRLTGAGWRATVLDVASTDAGQATSIAIDVGERAALAGFDVHGATREDAGPLTQVGVLVRSGGAVTDCRIGIVQTGIVREEGVAGARVPLIARNIISGTSTALAVFDAANVTHNTIVDNRFGIRVGPTSGATVVDNLIASNGGTGLSIYDSGAGDPPTAWNGAAHHNLIADNLVDYGAGLAPGDGDVNRPPFLLEPTLGNLSLGAGSPARHAASDGGDIGALPFTADGVAPTDLAVALSPDSTPDAPRWRATWTAAPGAARYHVWVSGLPDGQGWEWRLEVPLAFNWSDLAELELGKRHRVAVSSVTAAGESELSPEVAFVTVPPALEIEDDAAALTKEGDRRAVATASVRPPARTPRPR